MLKTITLKIPPQLLQMCVLAVGFAFTWWGIGDILYHIPNENLGIYIWGDQVWTFTKADAYLLNPYDIPGFINPPWVVALLAPIASLPLRWAVLVQLLIYFIALAVIVYRFGGGRLELCLILASPFALDNAIEPNIDWLVTIGLLVPRAYSAPFLLAKPQNAVGYLLSFSWQDIVRWVLVVLLLILMSFAIWGDWLTAWLRSAELYPVADGVNLAPASVLGWWASLLIGGALAWWSFKRRDALLAILAGSFFVPYLATYSFLLHFALILTRWKRAGRIIWLAFWIVFFYLAFNVYNTLVERAVVS
jgi:hypothetical protein